jgi:hypothetical protein
MIQLENIPMLKPNGLVFLLRFEPKRIHKWFCSCIPFFIFYIKIAAFFWVKEAVNCI